MTPIRLGVVGFGRRASYLFDTAIERIPDVVPAAICDLDLANEHINKAVEKHGGSGLQLFESFAEMLERADLTALLVET